MCIFKKGKIIRYFLILFFQLNILGSVLAQQEFMFTQYMNIPSVFNPAYAGSRGTLYIASLNRLQWVGMPEYPKTMVVSANSPVSSNIGVGLDLVCDKSGPLTETRIYADYAYQLKINNKTKLAFGLKAGMDIFEVNLLNLTGAEIEDEQSLNAINKTSLYNFGIGTYLYSTRFYLGFSIPKMLRKSLFDNNSISDYSFREVQHGFFSAGFVIDVDRNILLKPSLALRIVNGAPISSELSAAFLLHNKFWIGAMYRHHDSFGAMAGFMLSNSLNIGYSYDLNTSQLQHYNQGSHEIFISYDLIWGNKKILSPRYF